MSEHEKLVEVTRNADEIQTTFIGFLMDGRVIEIGDINHKPNRDNTRRIVTAVNYHSELLETLRNIVEPESFDMQVDAIYKAHTLLAALEAEKGGEL